MPVAWLPKAGHARRGLKEMFDSNGSPIAKARLKRIAQLYKIEDKIRGGRAGARPPDDVRQPAGRDYFAYPSFTSSASTAAAAWSRASPTVI